MSPAAADSGRPLSVVVYPHAMELGGSQMNAIDLAAAVRDLGHDVAVYAADGPLVERVHAYGLPYLPAASGRIAPSPARARDLARVVRERGVDVLHGYEWPPALEAYAAATATRRTAAVTVMSMSVAPFLPSSMPLVVGTERIRDSVADRRGTVDVIEPPVDTAADRPGAGGAEFRAAHGLDGVGPVVVVVGRLAHELKLEGIRTAVRAVGRLAASRPVRLVVVGDGPAREIVADEVAKANAEAGVEAVLMTGALQDPRPAYDAADICLGMGGSALRALAFGKPLIVQGERGFFQLVTQESVGQFLIQGWYGVGDGTTTPVDAFLAELVPVLDDVARRAVLGGFGRQLIEERFSLAHAAERQVEIYRRAIAAPPVIGVTAFDGARAGVGLVGYKVRRRVARWRGTASADDFNARPV